MRRYIALMSTALTLTACAAVDVKTDVTPDSLKDSIRLVERQTDTGLDGVLTLTKAQADFNAERYDDSYNSFQLLALKEPQNIDARIGWGNASIALNLFEKAYEIFSNRLALDTASTAQKHAHLAGLVLAEIATNRAADEELRLNEALEYNLHDVRLWNALGRFHDKQENWVPAQRTYIKALNAGPKGQSSAVNNLGMSFLKQGQYNMALEKFEQAADLKPGQNLYDNNRRLTLALMSNYAAATGDIAPQKAAMIFNDAGFIALTQKKYETAESLLTRAIDISPHFNVDAETNLSELKAQLAALDINSPLINSAQNNPQDWGVRLPTP
jgi:tetratricopeptide (TPR) repeat protein